jgi:hypothetical protein
MKGVVTGKDDGLTTKTTGGCNVGEIIMPCLRFVKYPRSGNTAKTAGGAGF